MPESINEKEENSVHLGIHELPLFYLKEHHILDLFIYPEMKKNYYWSSDFSAEYYIAQAKSGFIAICDEIQGEILLLPEIQFSYALLDFEDLHISKKVKKLLRDRELNLTISHNIDEVTHNINSSHKQSWMTKEYVKTLKTTKDIDKNFEVIAVMLKENDMLISGEIGYIIGATYTSLSGFTRREKLYNNYGTAQLVLLAKLLKERGFSFWNLGHPYMDYKFSLGAKKYERSEFLERWFKAIQLPKKSILSD